jgi:hypothetical protein
MEELLKIAVELETKRTILKKYRIGNGKLFYGIIEKNRD